MKYVAQYVDCAGNSFSAPVTKLSTGQWVLATASGPREVSFYIHGNDVAGGFATFQDFRLDDVPEGLRSCDYFEVRKRMYETLPWPQKPATAPTPIPEPEDFRLHVEQGNSFRVLQEAGTKAEAEYRTSRQQARQQALVEMNQFERPRGRGGFIVTNGNGE